MQTAGARARLTGSDYARLTTSLRAARGQVFGAGPPSILGSTKYCLDLSGVAAGDKPAVVRAALAKCQTVLPEGSALQLGRFDEQQIQRALTIGLHLPSDEAVEIVEQQQGSLSVSTAAGNRAWDIPIRQLVRAPPNCVEVVTVGWSRIPDALQRPGISKLLLEAFGYQGASVQAEFHPVMRMRDCPKPARLADKIVFWVERPANDRTLSNFPDKIEVEGWGEIRAYVGDRGSGGRAGQPARQQPPQQQQPPPPPQQQQHQQPQPRQRPAQQRVLVGR